MPAEPARPDLPSETIDPDPRIVLATTHTTPPPAPPAPPAPPGPGVAPVAVPSVPVAPLPPGTPTVVVTPGPVPLSPAIPALFGQESELVRAGVVVPIVPVVPAEPPRITDIFPAESVKTPPDIALMSLVK